MSGVAVLFCPTARIGEDLLRQMTETMAAHGPDVQDTWIAPHGNVGFGHTLLRTTYYQKHEHQPLTFDGSTWIVADARLDDRAALLSKLRTHGRTVQDDAPDVDLLLHAYQIWGEACHEHLLGDFGFVVWDERQHTLYGARDHLGVIPLYYTELENGLAMSTSMQALRLHPQVSDALNEQAIGDYLLFGCNQELDTTFFTDIRCVPPAHTFRWEGDRLHIRRYWQLPEAEPIYYEHPEAYTEHFLDIFTSAVVGRMRTDKVGVSMSGGLDSTSIAAVAHHAYREGTSPAEIRAYSAGFDWLMPDEERYWASLVAEHAGMPLVYISSEEALHAETLQEAWVLPPEPRMAPRRLPTYEVMVQARAYGARIVLNGLGGDPLFSHGKRPPSRSFRSRVRRHLGRLAGYGRGLLRPNALSTHALSHEDADLGWLNPDFVKRLHLRERWQEQTQWAATLKGPRQMAEHPFWSWALASSHPGFPAAPMKMRFPFFDVRLLTYIDRLPSDRLWRKQLLREAMQGLLPDAVRFRKKTPLQTDFLHAYAVRGQEPDMEALAALPALSAYVDQEQLERFVSAPALGSPMQYSLHVVLPLGLAYWLSHHSEVRAASITS